MSEQYSLTNREREVIKLLLEGKSNKLIAVALIISIRTVEFHLNNIYFKYRVASRLELVLKLTNAEFEKQGFSTVASSPEKSDNQAIHNSQLNWEKKMNGFIKSKHLRAGILTSLGTGFCWLGLLMHFGHMSMNKMLPWTAPLVLFLALLGGVTALIARRSGHSPRNVFFSTLLGTGLGFIAMFPLTVAVVLPIGKLLSTLGIIHRAAISLDTASNMASFGLICMWLISGIAIGTLLQRFSRRQTPPPLPKSITGI